MKLSTYGIGIALLCIVGAGTFVLSEGMSNHFFTPDVSPFVMAEENSQPMGSGYIIRGQLPPGKLTRRDASASNPLRAETEAQPLPPKPLKVQQVPPQPTKFQPIAQTALQNDSSSFSEIPEPPSAAQPSPLESVGFGAEPALAQAATQISAPLEPKRLSNVSVVEQPASSDTLKDSFSQELQQSTQGELTASQAGTNSFSNQQPNTPFNQPNTAEQLSNADPFTSEGRSASVPPQIVNPAPPVASRRSEIPQRAQFDHDFDSMPQVSSRQSASALSPTQQEAEGTGLPGPSILEGSQTPHLTIEKSFPAEIKVNEPATIKITLRNAGRSTAKNIVVRDRVPQGTRLLATSPAATQAENGELCWLLGNLDANEQSSVEMRLLPYREGEIGSVAVVNYTAEASARITVTKPMLKVDVKAPAEVQLGGIANVEITISNPGSATATGIVLEEYVPDGLYHKDGKVLVNTNVDMLKPKEAKKLTLPLTCTGAGNLVNRLVVKAAGNLMVEEKTTIRALAPMLKLGIEGASQQFLERKSIYRLIVANQGSSAAQNVDLVVTLPAAVKFVSTNQSGVYEPQTHSVHWALEELPAQESGEIELVLLPSQTGDHSIRFKGNGQNNLKAEESKQIMIDGLPAISFEVVGDSNLVEVGKETTYEIRVTNRGTKSASNVKVRANLSEGMTYTKADGPVRHQSNGSVVLFEPLTQLEAKGEKVYKIAAKNLADGDHRISVQVVSDDLSSPITKEESTRVFK